MRRGGRGSTSSCAMPVAKTTPPFPRLLSQTGLFTDTARHVPDPGLIPYDVNAPLLSDGAAKNPRFMALPGGRRSNRWRPTAGISRTGGAGEDVLVRDASGERCGVAVAAGDGVMLKQFGPVGGV